MLGRMEAHPVAGRKPPGVNGCTRAVSTSSPCRHTMHQICACTTSLPCPHLATPVSVPHDFGGVMSISL